MLLTKSPCGESVLKPLLKTDSNRKCFVFQCKWSHKETFSYPVRVTVNSSDVGYFWAILDVSSSMVVGGVDFLKDHRISSLRKQLVLWSGDKAPELFACNSPFECEKLIRQADKSSAFECLLKEGDKSRLRSEVLVRFKNVSKDLDDEKLIELCQDAVDNGVSLDALFETNPYVLRYIHKVQQYYNFLVAKQVNEKRVADSLASGLTGRSKNVPTFAIMLTGDSGIGKTYAMTTCLDVQVNLRRKPDLYHLRTTSTTEFWDPSVTDKTEVVLVDEYTISGCGFGPKLLTQCCNAQIVSVPLKGSHAFLESLKLVVLLSNFHLDDQLVSFRKHMKNVLDSAITRRIIRIDLGNPPKEVLENLMIGGCKNKYTIRVAGATIAALVTDGIDERLPCMVEHTKANKDEDVKFFATQVKNFVKSSSRMSFGLQSPSKSDDDSIQGGEKGTDDKVPLITQAINESQLPDYNLCRIVFPWKDAQNIQLISFTIEKQIKALKTGFSRGLNLKEWEDEHNLESFEEYNLSCVRKAREERQMIMDPEAIEWELKRYFIGEPDRKNDDHIDELNRFAVRLDDQYLMRSLFKLVSFKSAFGERPKSTPRIAREQISDSESDGLAQSEQSTPRDLSTTHTTPQCPLPPTQPAEFGFSQNKEQWKAARSVLTQNHSSEESLDPSFEVPSTQVPAILKTGNKKKHREITNLDISRILPESVKRKKVDSQKKN
jgi:hypothetical protein